MLDGEPVDQIPSLSYASNRKVELGVTDRMEDVSGGRPARFVRQYTNLLVEYGADLTLEVMGQEAELAMSGDGTTPLEGCDVRFTWSDDDAGWRAAWADDTK